MRVRLVVCPALVAGLCLAAGCRTPVPASSSAVPADEGAVIPEIGEVLGQAVPPVEVEARPRAKALALFGQGLIAEHRQDLAGALSNYLEAAVIDPDDEELNLRVAVSLLEQKQQDLATAWLENYCGRHPESRKPLLCLAVMYQAAADLPRLETVYRRLLRQSPRDAELYVELASICSRQGKDPQAVRLLKGAVSKVEKPADIWRALGGFYVQRAATAESAEAAAKDRQRALRVFERALSQVPDDTPLLFQLGNLYIQEQDAAGAMACFAKIESQYPDNMQLRQRLALSFGSAPGKTGIALMEQVVSDQPTNALARYYLGELYDNAGSRQRAVETFKAAAALDPPSPSAYIKLAVLQTRDNPAAALADLEEGSRRMPDEPRITEMAAYVCFSMKAYSNSVEHFAHALEQATRNTNQVISPGFYFNYAVACQMAGRLEQAAGLLNTAFEKNPRYLDAYLQYSFRRKEPQVQTDAVAVLEQVGRIQPDEPNVHVYLGFLNSYLKSFPGAIAAFEKAESLVQDSPQMDDVLDASFYFWYAAACERDGQFERAEKLFARCLEIDHEHPEAYNYLAYMWAEKGIHLDQALEYVQKALKHEPDSGAFIDTLGWIYYMQGKYREALDELNRAAKRIPDDPTVTDHLGDVLFKLGDTEQALPQWERSFLLDPENEKVAEKLKGHGVDLEPLRRKSGEMKRQKDLDEEKRGEAEERSKPLEETLPAFLGPSPDEEGETLESEPDTEEAPPGTGDDEILPDPDSEPPPSPPEDE